MARVFITGSSQGLGFMTGRLLAEEGHEVVLHARDKERAAKTRDALPEVSDVLVADVSTIAAMRSLAEQANKSGRFDAVVHNVGLGYLDPERIVTEDGLSLLWAVNVLTPFVLTALMERPNRLIYLSSGMQSGGDTSLEDLQWERRSWHGSQAYSDTKLQDTMLAFAVARLWPNVLSNAVSPGWVPTRMGGHDATDDLEQGNRTQAWLATANEEAAMTTGAFFYHKRPTEVVPAARDTRLQDRLLGACRDASGVELRR